MFPLYNAFQECNSDVDVFFGTQTHRPVKGQDHGIPTSICTHELVSRCEPQACCGEKANTVGAPRSQTPHDAVILHWAWAYIISIEQRVYTTPECWREYSTPVFIDLKTFQSK